MLTQTTINFHSTQNIILADSQTGASMFWVLFLSFCCWKANMTSNCLKQFVVKRPKYDTVTIVFDFQSTQVVHFLIQI